MDNENSLSISIISSHYYIDVFEFVTMCNLERMCNIEENLNYITG